MVKPLFFLYTYRERIKEKRRVCIREHWQVAHALLGWEWWREHSKSRRDYLSRKEALERVLVVFVFIFVSYIIEFFSFIVYDDEIVVAHVLELVNNIIIIQFWKSCFKIKLELFLIVFKRWSYVVWFVLASFKKVFWFSCINLFSFRASKFTI